MSMSEETSNTNKSAAVVEEKNIPNNVYNFPGVIADIVNHVETELARCNKEKCIPWNGKLEKLGENDVRIYGVNIPLNDKLAFKVSFDVVISKITQNKEVFYQIQVNSYVNDMVIAQLRHVTDETRYQYALDAFKLYNETSSSKDTE